MSEFAVRTAASHGMQGPLKNSDPSGPSINPPTIESHAPIFSLSLQYEAGENGFFSNKSRANA